MFFKTWFKRSFGGVENGKKTSYSMTSSTSSNRKKEKEWDSLHLGLLA